MRESGRSLIAMNFATTIRVLVQGIAEPLGSLYVPLMQSYGTPVVAGVSPAFGGTAMGGIPVFDLVEQAIEQVGPIDVTVLFVAPYLILDAALEAMSAGVRQIVLVTEGVPPLDMVRLLREAEATETFVVGPSSPGIIVPEKILLGTHPAYCYQPGSVGVISRSGTLTYEVALELTRAGLGQSIAVGIGGDAIVGSSYQQWLQILEEDDQTEAIVLIGEIGGESEETAARYIAEAIEKPVVAYVAGATAVRDQQIGHAGAIIAAGVAELGAEVGSVERKIAAFKQANVMVADRPSKVPKLVMQALEKTC